MPRQMCTHAHTHTPREYNCKTLCTSTFPAEQRTAPCQILTYAFSLAALKAYTGVLESRLAALQFFHLITKSVTQTPSMNTPERHTKQATLDSRNPPLTSAYGSRQGHWAYYGELEEHGGVCCFSSLLKGESEKSLTQMITGQIENSS